MFENVNDLLETNGTRTEVFQNLKYVVWCDNGGSLRYLTHSGVIKPSTPGQLLYEMSKLLMLQHPCEFEKVRNLVIIVMINLIYDVA